VEVEIFVDFGLFEVIAAAGIGLLAQAINRRPVVRGVALLIGIAAPAVLLWFVRGESLRWVAAVSLGTSLINASIITSIAGANRPGAVCRAAGFASDGASVISDGRVPDAVPESGGATTP
jgi:hypothetical protein